METVGPGLPVGRATWLTVMALSSRLLLPAGATAAAASCAAASAASSIAEPGVRMLAEPAPALACNNAAAAGCCRLATNNATCPAIRTACTRSYCGGSSQKLLRCHRGHWGVRTPLSAGAAAKRACALVPWKANELTPVTAGWAAVSGRAPGWRGRLHLPCCCMAGVM